MRRRRAGATTAASRLSYITDGRALRLFVWKLHNAVSASIERSEAWYKPADSMNTSRYWPNMQATLRRAEFGSACVSATRLRTMCDVLDVAVELSHYRDALIELDAKDVDELMAEIRPKVAALDEAIVASGILPEAYRFNARLVDAVPSHDAHERLSRLARDEHFTLN